MEPRIRNDSLSSQNIKDGGNEKQRKKASKFHRVRLGDGSIAAAHLVDLQHSGPDTHNTVENRVDDHSGGGLPVRGVWRKGGGQKLFS
ncbi:hypothetical protein OIU76_005537 [Salix suchowensis]|nr:hypothetical protein OIU76_005537 [Salix suchowensis]